MPNGGNIVIAQDTAISAAMVLPSTAGVLHISAENGAVLSLGVRLTLGGETVFDNITIHNAATSSMFIVAANHPVTFEDGVVCTSTSGGIVYPSVVGGAYSAASSGGSHITVKGGTWRNVYGGNYNGAFTGNSVVDFTGGTVLLTLCGGNYWGNFEGDTHITFGGEAVNVIPAEVTVESFIRDGKMESIYAANKKFNRAFAGCAAAMGCRLVVEDKHGYAPRKDDENLNFALGEIGKMLLPVENVHLTHGWDTGCTDMGDISFIMPQATAYHGCSTKPGHSKEYITEFPEDCLTSAKIQAGFCAYLLQNDASFAKKVIAEAVVPCKSKEEYFAMADALSFTGETVFYGENEIRIKI